MFYKILSIVPFFLLSTTSGAPRTSKEVSINFMRHFKFTHMAGISSQISCGDPRTYMTGFKIRSSPHLNQTFDSVTALKIACSNLADRFAFPEHALLFDKNIGNWSDFAFCPKGSFAYGFTIHMQTLQAMSLTADDEYDYRSDGGARTFDVFQLGRGRYVSGITLNCSSTDLGEDFVFPFAPPSPTPVVTLGWNSGFGLRIFCVDQRVAVGMQIIGENVLAYDEGERMIPTKLLLDCALPELPGSSCIPSLSWEELLPSNVNCNGSLHNLTLPLEHRPPHTFRNDTNHHFSLPERITCSLNNSVGTALDPDIENLDELKRAYKHLNFEAVATIEIISKFLKDEFRKTWLQFNLTSDQYDRVMKQSGFTRLSHFHLLRINLRYNLTEGDFAMSEMDGMIGSGFGLRNRIYFTQLVGHCGLFKIRFPMTRVMNEIYFEVKLGENGDEEDDKRTEVVVTEKELLTIYNTFMLG